MATNVKNKKDQNDQQTSSLLKRMIVKQEKPIIRVTIKIQLIIWLTDFSWLAIICFTRWQIYANWEVRLCPSMIKIYSCQNGWSYSYDSFMKIHLRVFFRSDFGWSNHKFVIFCFKSIKVGRILDLS